MKIVAIFFQILGVIFFLILGAGVWFYIEDPYEIRPLISILLEMRKPNEMAPPAKASADSAADAKTPGEAQQQPAETNESALPMPTPEQAACFLAAIGIERAQELLEGAVPTSEEIEKLRACL